MSFPVAVQSAIFYLIACTPCAQVRHRQKARQLAKKERREKARLVTEQPGLYRHPSPFNTNPYWQHEIAKGPGLPKKSTSKNSSQRGLTSAAGVSSVPSLSDRTQVQSSHTNVDSSPAREHVDDANNDANKDANMKSDANDNAKSDANDNANANTNTNNDAIPSDWNRKIGYQREDEELWGQWSGQKLKDAISKARDSAGRLIESTLGLEKEVTDQERRDFYTTPRNPPVNDYHPPVVSSRPSHKDAHKWMIQPPPAAKIMEGKVPVSRAVSSGSKSSSRTIVVDDPFFEKIVQDRLAREKANQGPGLTESELIESLFVTRSNQNLTRRRSLSFDGSDDPCDGLFQFEKRWRPKFRPMTRPPGVAEGKDDDNADDSYVLVPLIKPVVSHAAQRSKLETIHSSDGSVSSARDLTRKSRRTKSRRSRLKNTVGSPVGDDTD